MLSPPSPPRSLRCPVFLPGVGIEQMLRTLEDHLLYLWDEGEGRTGYVTCPGLNRNVRVVSYLEPPNTPSSGQIIVNDILGQQLEPILKNSQHR